jgi:hypothetical protein
MKAKLQKLIGTAVLGLALCANNIPAWAGSASSNEVYIDPGILSVQGSLTGARYSADREQYLECDSTSYSSAYTNDPFVQCSAKDKSGRYFFCYSPDPRFVDAVKGMTDASHIYVTRNRIRQTCTDLEITNGSIYLK